MQEFRLRWVVEALLGERRAEGWTLTENDVWCRVEPADGGAVERIQGWKLHVSATRFSAPEVLHRVAGPLVDHGCAFKFAKSIAVVEELTGERADRAQCGKVITVYPADDDQLRALAVALDDATAGLPGPAILSDRPLRPGSLVHYRYGAFQGVPVLTDDGVHQLRVAAPDGTPVEDLRKPWFSPPPWTEPPFPAASAKAQGPAEAAPARGTGPRPVLVADRYEVREAIRQAARGGVYRAVDRTNGAPVIVKQARAHVGVRWNGRDARDGLRAEAAALATLAGIAAEPIEVFDKGGHTFLVESLLPGQTLAAWVTERLDETGPLTGLHPREALPLARKLADLLDQVHERGLVFQDFTPPNIMVALDGGLKLMDPELAAVPGTWAARGHTPGFAAPETLVHPRQGPVPQQTADLFSLGAVLFYATVGTAPLFGEDKPEPLSVHGRISALLTAVGEHNPAARLLAPAIRGLTADTPGERWSVQRLRTFLAEAAGADAARTGASTTPVTHRASAPDAPDRLAPAEQERMADEGLAHVLATLAPSDAHRLWPSTDFGSDTDPCNVQHGSAGVLSVLTLADRLLGREELHSAVAHAARWTDRRRNTAPRLLPGLYFGRSGTAWALFDAARHLCDPELEQHSVELALGIPVVWPNPDVCHGVAGALIAQLHLWRGTGRPEFLHRVRTAADTLLAAAVRESGQVYWPVPAGTDSLLAGITHLGFAHGVAGVGYALLATAQATGEEKYLEAAVAAGATLAATAERAPWGASWRTDRADAPGAGLRFHWCSGSSGVGTFLLRLWRATGDTGCLTLAEEAAAAVRQVKWASGTSACHGLAGNGEFLLDLADAIGGPYHGWAEELAAAMVLRHAVHEERQLVPDESLRTVAVDYNVGLSGAVGFLLRLRHGGSRPWMADGLATDAFCAAGPTPRPAGQAVPGR
ncbi:class IV lanthionine synthetase LanL [Streptomyces sp. NPDC059828]|uniref:class IV lanthionine synthetase LanL n=1 Tax=Streptomyces sp. NPDC059828 TaxID=3346965 RepID=UPI00364C9495